MSLASKWLFPTGAVLPQDAETSVGNSHFEARVASALTFAAIGTSASSLSLEESNGSVVFGYKEQAQAAVASAGA